MTKTRSFWSFRTSVDSSPSISSRHPQKSHTTHLLPYPPSQKIKNRARLRLHPCPQRHTFRWQPIIVVFVKPDRSHHISTMEESVKTHHIQARLPHDGQTFCRATSRLLRGCPLPQGHHAPSFDSNLVQRPRLDEWYLFPAWKPSLSVRIHSTFSLITFPSQPELHSPYNLTFMTTTPHFRTSYQKP